MVETSNTNDLTHILRITQEITDRQNKNSDGFRENRPVEEELLDRNQIAREVFFICKKCNGPLVQFTFCRICKKTSLRICAKCGLVKADGNHRDCFRLLLLDMKKISFKKK
jgi:hypothetical protein